MANEVLGFSGFEFLMSNMSQNTTQETIVATQRDFKKSLNIPSLGEFQQPLTTEWMRGTWL